MHNKKSIRQDGFEEVYAANMTKPRTKILKTGRLSGRKRMDERTKPAAKPPAQCRPPWPKRMWHRTK